VIALGVGALGAALVPALHQAFGSMDGLLWALLGFVSLAALATAALPSLKAAAVAEAAE